MKKVLPLMSVLFVGIAGIAFSQTGASTPAASTTPAAGAVSMKGKMESHPMINEIRARIEAQNERIGMGVKNKTITQAEAKTLHTAVKAVREELMSDLKTNGTKELTMDQFNKLKQELADNAKAIHTEKAEGVSQKGPAARTTPAAK